MRLNSLRYFYRRETFHQSRISGTESAHLPRFSHLLIRSGPVASSGEPEKPSKNRIWLRFDTLLSGAGLRTGLPVPGQEVPQVALTLLVVFLGREVQGLLCGLNGLVITTRLVVRFRQLR